MKNLSEIIKDFQAMALEVLPKVGMTTFQDSIHAIHFKPEQGAAYEWMVDFGPIEIKGRYSVDLKLPISIPDLQAKLEALEKYKPQQTLMNGRLYTSIYKAELGAAVFDSWDHAIIEAPGYHAEYNHEEILTLQPTFNKL